MRWSAMKQRTRAVLSPLSVVGVIAVVIAGTVITTPPVHSQSESGKTAESCAKDAPFCHVLVNNDSTPSQIEKVTSPKVTEPEWLKKYEEEQRRKVVVTYRVETRGNTEVDQEGFAQTANETLKDARGWSRMGIDFQRVQEGGQFTLVLSEASQMTSFSSGCDRVYSCRAGQYVIINQDRWLGATDSWNAAGGSLRDYRHMVINHEVGHWLGHDHAYCGGPGQPAPVMQQQSINLQGCSFNPWPLDSELSAPMVGL